MMEKVCIINMEINITTMGQIKDTNHIICKIIIFLKIFKKMTKTTRIFMDSTNIINLQIL